MRKRFEMMKGLNKEKNYWQEEIIQKIFKLTQKAEKNAQC